MDQATSGGVKGVPTPARQWPPVRKIGIDDLIEAFGAGIRDFRAAPKYGLAIGAFCASGGWLILALLWQFNMPYFAYPMAMGFVLVAPFVVTGALRRQPAPGNRRAAVVVGDVPGDLGYTAA